MSTNTDGGTLASLSNTPQAKDDYYAILEDGCRVLDVMANDLGGNAKVLWSIDTTSDDGVQDLVAKDVVGCVDNSEMGAAISLTSDGKILYDTRVSAQIAALAAGETAVDQFTYAIRLSNGTLSWATVNVTITGTNDAPDIRVGSGDSASAGINETNATLSACGTLTVSDPDSSDTVNVNVSSVAISGTGGASGIDNDTLKAMLSLTGNVANAADGTAGSLHWSFNSTPEAFNYLAAGETLVLTYTLTASDGHGGSDTQTVTITITGTNDLPTVAGALHSEANEGDASYSLNLLQGAGDVDHGETATLTVTNVSYQVDGGPSSATAPAGVSLSGSSLTVDPTNAAYDHLAAGATTVIVVSYDVTDVHGATVSQTETITITGTNDAPVVSSAIPDQSSNEDAAWSYTIPAGTFTDPDDGTTLTYSAELSNHDPLPGWLTFNAATQTFSGTPPADFNGVLQITVTASDGSLQTSDTFQLTINPVNDAPVNTVPASFTTAEDTAVKLAGLSVADVDAASSTISVSLNVGSGSIAAASTGGVTATGSGTGTVVLTGTLADINAYLAAAASQPSYVPAANANGDVTLTVTTSDNGHNGSGGTLMDVDTSTIHVTAVNDPAIITGPITGDITEDASPNIVGGNLNSTDVDGTNDLWTVGSGNSANGYGTFTIDAAGNWVYTLNNGNTTVNNLNDGGTLSDSFTVTTADGTSQLVSITIHGHTDVVVVTLPPTENGADPNDFDTLVGTNPVDNSASINGGNTTNDNITGGTAGQNIDGKGGNDTIYGGGGGDTINGNTGDDILYGQAGVDSIDGNNGFDTVYGGSGGDNITGGNDNDTIYGGSGGDTINGQGGDDHLIGGYGADTLTGAGGNDVFVYLDVRDTNDTIQDFTAGDKIDFSAIDANPALAGDQGFAFGGTTATAHGVWYAQSGANVVVYLDTDGNTATAELSLTLNGVTTLSGTDFLLGP